MCVFTTKSLRLTRTMSQSAGSKSHPLSTTNNTIINQNITRGAETTPPWWICLVIGGYFCDWCVNESPALCKHFTLTPNTESEKHWNRMEENRAGASYTLWWPAIDCALRSGDVFQSLSSVFATCHCLFVPVKAPKSKWKYFKRDNRMGGEWSCEESIFRAIGLRFTHAAATRSILTTENMKKQGPLEYILLRQQYWSCQIITHGTCPKDEGL